MRAEPPAEQSTPPRRPRVAARAGALVALQSAAGNAAVQRLLAQRYLDDPSFKHSHPPDFSAFRRGLDETHKPPDALTYVDDRVGNAAQAFIVRLGRSGEAETVALTPYMSGNPISLVDGEKKYPPLVKKSKGRPDNRSACAERRVVDEVRRVLGTMLPDTRPVVYLYTEHLPCKDCASDIKQMANGHTWVDFVVRWRESFVQDQAGAEEWLAKRRNAAGWCTMTFPHTVEPPPRARAARPTPDRAGARPRVDEREKKTEDAVRKRADRRLPEPLPPRVEVGGPAEAVALVERARQQASGGRVREQVSGRGARERVRSGGRGREQVASGGAGRRGEQAEGRGERVRREQRRGGSAAGELVVREGGRQWVSVAGLVGLLVGAAAVAAVVEVLLQALGYR